MRRSAWLVLALASAGAVAYAGLDVPHALLKLALGTPHERYAAGLQLGWRGDDLLEAAWLTRAEAALADATPSPLPQHAELRFPADAPDAAAFTVSLRRGQRLVAEAEAIAATETAALFLDLFRRADGELHHVANAARAASALAYEVRHDGEYVLRLQPELGHTVFVRIAQRAEPTLRLPVEGATAANIRSTYGAPRDAGTRAHEGIDIFAPRGTRVLAAAGGVVSSVGTNRLGGNVVWVWRPARGESHYYAHLDTHAVAAGTPVDAGDVLGTVGNTGNARTTAPHLHFGIYAAGGAVDPFPYVAPP